MSRKIGDDIYWPLTDLDLLYTQQQQQRKDKSKLAATQPPFVCSQSITVFDNLVNQTFTVVNSLQLSHYNTNVEEEVEDVVDEPTTGPRASSAQPELESNKMPLIALPQAATQDDVDDDKLFSLYACIVDADVRHNYATLGVNFRRASSGKLRRRLRAKSLFGRQQQQQQQQAIRGVLATNTFEEPTSESTSNQVDDELVKLDFLRKEHLHCK